MSVILEAHNLCKSFSNGKEMQHVLRNLDIEIRKGDFTIIMGSSGSGKSTLLYALSGMDKANLGTISFQGTDITDYSNDKLAVFRREHCGFVFQQIYLNNTMSILDNVLICGLLVNKDRKKITQLAKQRLLQCGLHEEDFRKLPGQLSGGEAQRAAIVRAIINEPEILFADEPTGALNSANSTHVLDVFTELNRQGQSIVMVTHDLKTARRANRILYLKDGIIEAECNLGEYVPNDRERHERLRAFLKDMGW